MFEISDIQTGYVFGDINRKLKNDYFLENQADYDEHLLKLKETEWGESDLNCIYPATPILPDVYYTVDFSKYKLYAYTEHIDFDSTFSYSIYSNTDNDHLFEDTFTVKPGSQGTRIPLKNFKIRYGSNIKEFRFTIIVRNETVLGIWSLKETEGNISIKLDNARYNLSIEFLSGMEEGNVYNCMFNPIGHPESSPKYNTIRISVDASFSMRDKYKLRGLKYDKIPTSYFTSDHQEADVVTEGVVEKRLRLPKGMDHIDAWENMRDEDVIEGVVAFEEVYPKREGAMTEVTQTVGKVVDKDKNPTGETYPLYRFKDSGLIFSEEYLITRQELRIQFQTGSLAGLEFAVWFEPNNDKETAKGSQVFEIVRSDEYGAFLPNEISYPKAGDKYILSGYDTQFVDESLIPAAEQELLSVAREYLKKNSVDSSVYTCKTNPVRCAGYIAGRYSKDFEIDFEVGQKIKLVNPAYFNDGRVSRIYGFEKRLDNKFECTYTIGETASYSRIGAIEEKLEEITFKGQSFTGTAGSGVYLITSNDNTRPGDQNAFSALRSKYEFLSRLNDDKAEGLIQFIKGFTSQEIATFFSGISVTGSARADRIISSILDSERDINVLKHSTFERGILSSGIVEEGEISDELNY